MKQWKSENPGLKRVKIYKHDEEETEKEIKELQSVQTLEDEDYEPVETEGDAGLEDI